MEEKIGVFICDCGKSLSNIDFSAIKEKLGECKDIASIHLSHNLCFNEGQEAMLSDILDKGITRVVVAACSPELQEHNFRNVLERAGLNPCLLSMANIREQCSWAHEGEVTQKAMVEIRMALNRARLLKPVERRDVPVNKEVLVIGGGLAGMQAALELAQLGLRATMVERSSNLGGRLKERSGYYGLEIAPEQMLESMTRAIGESKNMEVLTSATVTGVEGEVGNFRVKIAVGGRTLSRSYGAIILATGYETRFSSQAYGLEPANNVITHSQLEDMLKSPAKVQRVPRSVGFVLDMSDEHSRISTILALNNSLALKQRFGSEVYIFCKNLKIDGDGLERVYQKARDRGVLFIKFEEAPRVSKINGRIRVQARDILLGEEVVVLCDFLVVDEKPMPTLYSEALRSMLNLGLDSRGFYQEENIHLYPVGSAIKGIFLAGNCHADLDLPRVLIDAGNAASEVYALLSQGKLTVEVNGVKIDPNKCRLCLTCIRVCPHHAIRVAQLNHEKQAAQISDLACDGCGICAAICPAGAIKFEGYGDEQIFSQLEAIGERL